MTILKSHYDKIVLAGSFLLALTMVFLSAFSESQTLVSADDESGETYWFDANEKGAQTLEVRKDNNLLPGDLITFVSKQDASVADSFEIDAVILLDGADYVIRLPGKTIQGALVSGTDVILRKNWKSAKTVLNVLPDSGRPLSLPLSDVQSITGERRFLFDEPVEEYDAGDRFVSLYQGMRSSADDANETKPERVRWTTSAEESDDSIYDLFTPPIIYLIDGNLTAKLPEKVEVQVEKVENFGLSLQSFQKKPYRFRMKGFTSEFPFFEDLDPGSKAKRLNTRIRIEAGKPYKSNAAGKPGAPSLVPTTEDDEDKLMMVTVFRVDTVQDEKTGGVRPIGRAMVLDYRLGGKPFEIRHGWNEVFAGENEVELVYRLDGAEEKIVLSDQDVGKVLEFGSRKYLVKEIDPDGKSLLVEKRGPGPNDLRTEKLTHP